MMTATEDIRCEPFGSCLACHGEGDDPRENAIAHSRHALVEHRRRRAGLPPIGTKPPKAPKRAACSRCGVSMDERTPGCPTCRDRHRWRRWQARTVERFERSRAGRAMLNTTQSSHGDLLPQDSTRA